MGSDNCRLLGWSSSSHGVRGYLMWFLIMFPCAIIAAQRSADHPECHIVGYSKIFMPPGCEAFLFVGNACYGYCESQAFATNTEQLEQNPNQVITSTSTCCEIDETEDTVRSLECTDGTKEFIVKSAKSCHCSLCKNDSD